MLQRNEAYFPEPLTFQPERFDPENGQEIKKYAYLPFSTGPRICIGNAFAMMQMKINLATIWQRYRLTHAPDHTFEPFYAFNTRPKNGLPMIVHHDNRLSGFQDPAFQFIEHVDWLLRALWTWFLLISRTTKFPVAPSLRRRTKRVGSAPTGLSVYDPPGQSKAQGNAIRIEGAAGLAWRRKFGGEVSKLTGQGHH